MTISYKRKRLKHYLIFGLIWLGLGAIALIFDPDNYFNYGYIIIGFLYLGTYIFEKKNHYLKIENGFLIKNNLILKQIKLDSNTSIKTFAGDIILKRNNAELRVNTDFLEENSINKLNKKLIELVGDPA